METNIERYGNLQGLQFDHLCCVVSAGTLVMLDWIMQH